jgi:hypothetical protein
VYNKCFLRYNYFILNTFHPNTCTYFQRGIASVSFETQRILQIEKFDINAPSLFDPWCVTNRHTFGQVSLTPFVTGSSHSEHLFSQLAIGHSLPGDNANYSAPSNAEVKDGTAIHLLPDTSSWCGV